MLAGSFAMTFALFFIGTRRYRKQSPSGSPLTTVAQVFIAAAKKWRVSETQGGRGICYEDQKSGSHANYNETRGHTLARTKQLR